MNKKEKQKRRRQHQINKYGEEVFCKELKDHEFIWKYSKRNKGTTGYSSCYECIKCGYKVHT